MVKIKPSRLGLLFGALGVVFGDIGTSPLYAIKVVFGQHGLGVPVTELTVLGVLSLVLWTVTIVVSLKYIGYIMQAGNKGEGGIMALVARLGSTALTKRQLAMFLGLGLVGVALFYGDSAITPAISVLSAVEGLNVLPVHASQYVVPLTLVILGSLFWLQHYGTALIGRLFGPVMLVWFVSIGAAGLGQVVHNPQVLAALSPLQAVEFAVHSPLLAFTAMGAVVLAVTGAEALYADMGHFGRAAVARAWFWVVFPALMLCYMGQGALVLYDSSTSANPFFLLFPTVLHIPVIILAALATLVASQSVISGAFSLSRQAMQLGFLPRMAVWQTSDREHGQIYIPAVNLLLFAAVLLCVLLFSSSERLAGAYGVAVSGALIVDTVLFTVIMRAKWNGLGRVRLLVMALFLGVDALLVISTFPKVWHGGWLPLLFALLVLVLIDSWRKGEAIIRAERRTMEGPLQAFIDKLHAHKLKPLTRVGGQAVFIGHHPGFTPMALRDAAENLHELPKKLVIVYVKTADAAHIPEGERAEFDGLAYTDGISQVTLTFGFHDLPHIPHELNLMRSRYAELDFDPYTASYFISLSRAVQTGRHNMPGWQKSLYILLDRVKVSSSDYYRLPIEQTSEVRTLIKL